MPRARHFLKLWHQIRLVWREFSAQPEATPAPFAFLKNRLDEIFGGSRAVSAVFSEVILVSTAEGGLAIGEAAIVGVESHFTP